LPVIWAAISAHGFGHAAQVIPVLNELGVLVPDLRVILRTTVPVEFFSDRLRIPWSLQPVRQDIGCVQDGPLRIDVDATWKAHADFHVDWERRVEAETSSIQACRPDLVLSNTSYLACRAGSQAGVPTVGLTSLTWSEILCPHIAADRPDQLATISLIDASYAGASLALRIAPGLPLAPFKNAIDIGPITEPSPSQRAIVRARLNIADSDRLVLVGFGGIPLTSLPWAHMNAINGVRFVFDGEVPASFPRVISLKRLAYSFKTMLASCDAVMTKPGYGTVVESVALALPVLYVRRYTFAEEQPLVDFLNAFGRSFELPFTDFIAGRWENALETVFAQKPHLAPPPFTGAAEAAKYLASLL
jgi:hypothetical protein